jgi:hypothetical protein
LSSSSNNNNSSVGDDGEGSGSESEGVGVEESLEEEARAAAAQSIYLPRCLCVLSKYPFVSTTRAWLMQLYRLSLTPTPGKEEGLRARLCCSPAEQRQH